MNLQEILEKFFTKILKCSRVSMKQSLRHFLMEITPSFTQGRPVAAGGRKFRRRFLCFYVIRVGVEKRENSFLINSYVFYLYNAFFSLYSAFLIYTARYPLTLSFKYVILNSCKTLAWASRSALLVPVNRKFENKTNLMRNLT